MLPHQFPFKFVAASSAERASAALSVNAFWSRAASEFPAPLLIEMLAQAAIVLIPGAAEGSRGLLAGVDQARFGERALSPGDTLHIEVERSGSFGRLTKVAGRITCGTELVCEAGLLLAREE